MTTLAVYRQDWTVVGWRAWYDQGRYFDSSTYLWDDLPQTGVQEVVVYWSKQYAPGEHYRDTIGGRSAYRVTSTGWEVRGTGESTGGIELDLVPEADSTWKFGTSIADEEFATIMADSRLQSASPP